MTFAEKASSTLLGLLIVASGVTYIFIGCRTTTYLYQSSSWPANSFYIFFAVTGGVCMTCGMKKIFEIEHPISWQTFGPRCFVHWFLVALLVMHDPSLEDEVGKHLYESLLRFKPVMLLGLMVSLVLTGRSIWFDYTQRKQVATRKTEL